MNNATLAQATLMALTMQNVTPRNAPNATATMNGLVITRNIKTGDTVCCYYNGTEELTRVGEVPPYVSPTYYSRGYYIDDNNKMYDMESGKLRIRDGLSGTVYDDESINAYGFLTFYNCSAYKCSNEANTNLWVFILPDGTFSNPIQIDTSRMDWMTAGYANGVIAVHISTPPNFNPQIIRTYTKEGRFIAQLVSFGAGLSGNPGNVCPINGYTVSVAINIGLLAGQRFGHYIVTLTGATQYDIYDGYETRWNKGKTTTQGYLGADQRYHYFSAEITEYNEDTDDYYKTGEQVIIQCSLDGGSKRTVIDTMVPLNYTDCTMLSHAIRSRTVDGVTIRQMMDLSLGTSVWESDLPDIVSNASMQENNGWIWIPQTGVYQKSPEGWLMYPTSEYPTHFPWGRLGYAVHDADIGKEGLAIVLFDKG